MGDMEGSNNRSVAQSLATAQAARNSYNQQHQQQQLAQQPYVAANNGETNIDVDRRRGHIQGDVEERSFTIRLYTYYFRDVLGILRIVELVVSIIVIATANAEQCVNGNFCGAPSSPMWYGDLGGQGFVLFVGIIFIFGNIAIIFYHLFVKPSSMASSMAENIRFGELIYSAIAVVLFIIAASVEAWYASWTDITIKPLPERATASTTQLTFRNPYRPQWIASTIFAWINVLVYIADAVYMYFFDDGAPSVSGSSNR